MERVDIAGISLETVIGRSRPPLLFLYGGDYVAQNAPVMSVERSA